MRTTNLSLVGPAVARSYNNLPHSSGRLGARDKQANIELVYA